MEIKEITSKEVWENFLAEIKPATFLQSWNWGEFNARTDHKIWRIGCYENGKLEAIALIIKVTARRGNFLFCPHGPVSPFGKGRGPLSGEGFASIISALTHYLIPIAKQERCAFVRISPIVEKDSKSSVAESDHPPLAKEEVFTNLGYREAPIHMMHPELGWILDITPSEEQLLANMRKTTRYSIKKAEKDGVAITTSSNPADFEKFYEIYKETVKRQEFKGFSEAYFRAEIEIFFSQNQGMFFFAEYKGQITGTAIIIFYGDSAYYHHAATNRKFEKLTDAQLMQWHVIKEAKRRGLHFYNFWGVVEESKTKHPWHGLSVFKRGFGGFETRYVHAKDLVLSPRYWLTYIIEAVRKIKRGL